jgi:hypothetical protein
LHTASFESSPYSPVLIDRPQRSQHPNSTFLPQF